MLIWLDNNQDRDPNSDNWTIIRSADEAIKLIENNDIKMISLDRDLNNSDGLDLIKWMCNTKKFPSFVNLHSSVWYRAKDMMNMLADYAPASTVVRRFSFNDNLINKLEGLIK